MINTMLVILALFALAVGSATDIKKREVPDWISYGLIFSALGVRLLYSLFTKQPTTVLNGVFGFVIFWVIANVLYRLKQWGGGDAKIFMGLGAVIGLGIFNVQSYTVLGIFVLLIIFTGAFYGIIYSGILALKNKQNFRKAYAENMKDFRYVVWFANVFLFGFLVFFVLNPENSFAFLLLGVSLIFFLGIHSFMLTKSVEKTCLLQKVKAYKLTEGDWVMETIRHNGKVIVKKDNLGITKAQIKALKTYKKPILIKLGIPFIPAFLIAYIILLLARDALLSAVY